MEVDRSFGYLLLLKCLTPPESVMEDGNADGYTVYNFIFLLFVSRCSLWLW